MIGFGLFIDDIERIIVTTAIRFGVIGLVVFAIVLVAAFLMSRGIYRALGEPGQAAAVARAIARGDLSQHIDHTGGNDLMESMQQMQSQIAAVLFRASSRMRTRSRTASDGTSPGRWIRSGSIRERAWMRLRQYCGNRRERRSVSITFRRVRARPRAARCITCNKAGRRTARTSRQ